MKNKAQREPLLFVDSVIKGCQIEEQTMYKTPQPVPDDIIQSDFVHSFQSSKVVTSKEIVEANTIEPYEAINIVVDEHLSDTTALESTKQELRDIISYLQDVLKENKSPIIQLSTSQQQLIGQLSEMTPNAMILHTFENEDLTVEYHQLENIHILKL